MLKSLDRSRDAIARRRRLNPYGRVQFRGHTLDRRTRSAFLLMERRYRRSGKGWPKLRIGQGSYASGSLSAGTHSGGGAVDVMFAGLNPAQRAEVVRQGRRVGFAMWARTGPAWGANGSNDHAHGILLGHRTASPEAKKQMDAYRAGRDGLAGNLADNTWRPKRPRRFSYFKGRPVIGK